MKVIGYIRVSTDSQDVMNQRHEILEFAHGKGIKVDEFVSVEISSRKTQAKRRIDELWSKLAPGDILIVSELSRIGRSTAEVINLVNDLVDRKVRFIAIKQNIDINGTRDTTSKVEEIKHLLSLGVSKASIAKICGVKRSTLLYYINSRGLNQI